MTITLTGITEEYVTVICSEASIHQRFLIEDLPALVKDIYNLKDA